jgi:RHS repeat-associated protein
MKTEVLKLEDGTRVRMPSRWLRFISIWLVAVMFMTQPGMVYVGYLNAAEKVIGEKSKTYPEPVLTPQDVQVNRTAPTIETPSADLTFSGNVTDAELYRAFAFKYRLIPTHGSTNQEENSALATAIQSYRNRSEGDDFSALAAFITSYPNGRFAMSLLLNLGENYLRKSYFSKAQKAFEDAWAIAKNVEVGSPAKVQADVVTARLANFYGKIGDFEKLKGVVASTKGKKLSGAAATIVGQAEKKSWQPAAKAFLCGAAALQNLKRAQDREAEPFAPNVQAGENGLSLAQLKNLSQSRGMNLQVAKRSPGAPIITPALVHWKVGHYAALTENSEGRVKLLDPSFARNQLVTAKTLDEESSGYFLVSAANLPEGWSVVSDTEAATIWGKGEGDGIPDPDPKKKKCCNCHGNGEGSDDDDFDPEVYDPGADAEAYAETGGSEAGRAAEKKASEMVMPWFGGSKNKGMASAHVLMATTSLTISDTPLGYKPPRGPPVTLAVRYGHREVNDLAAEGVSNFGPLWNFNWMSYLEDDSTNPYETVILYVAGGGSQSFTDYDPASQEYGLEPDTVKTLKRISSTRFELLDKNGSKRVFAQPNATVGANRKVFLTEIHDALGNKVTLTYDANYRLSHLTDALGQVTTFSYGLTSNSGLAEYKIITGVTDPFGRTASFEYDSSDRLVKITDVIGITSEFAYEDSADDYANFITDLTTSPYGTTTFTHSDPSVETDHYRMVQTTFPSGEKERVEFRQETGSGELPAALTNNISAVDLPEGMATGKQGEYSGWRNAFFWDKRAMQDHSGSDVSDPSDYLLAEITHFMNSTVGAHTISSVVEWEKKPLEKAVHYNYKNQGAFANYFDNTAVELVATVGRRVNNHVTGETNVTQLTQFEYNEQGNMTRKIEPALSGGSPADGRTTIYGYAANGIDMTSVKKLVSGSEQTLMTSTYNSQHLPLTVTDSAGQTTTFTYNSFGQVLTITNPKSEVTTYAYDSNGYLQTITGAIAGSTVSFTYDSYGRVRTMTDPDGSVKTIDYDALDRITKVTYDDATFDQMVYVNPETGKQSLDVHQTRDRRGRWSRTFYDSVRRVVAVQDPQNRVTQFEWCTCGGLSQLIDANGKVTRWFRDLQGRVTSKKYSGDGSSDVITYSYDATSGRLESTTDLEDQITSYQYHVDGKIKQVDYDNENVSTPSVEYTYDSSFDRVTKIIAGAYTNQFTYHAITGSASPGAGSLATADGQFTNDTITYSYDELGRVKDKAINSVNQTFTFDALGRVTASTNALGSFSYTYVTNTARLSKASMPNGVTNTFDYFDENEDNRLKQILNKSGASTISKFDYTYDDEGQIRTWTQQRDSSVTNTYTFGYDLADQLTSAVLKNTGSGAIQSEYSYTYDKAGNRTSEQIDASVGTAAYNANNQLTSTSGGGKVRFKGSVNEPATVTVGGTSAFVTNNQFMADITLNSGSTNVAVSAQDYSGNSTNASYSLNVTAATAKTFLYDLNGNTTNMNSGGVNTAYEWDAKDQLVKISTNGVAVTDFAYDGMGRRVQEINHSGGSSTTNFYVWSALSIAEERSGSNGTTVEKRYFGQGVQRVNASSPGKYIFNRDHLGSIREVINSAGSVAARYDYDPYGRRTLVSGTDLADFGFTGHYYHGESGLHLAPYRAYSADLGRWLSRDPISEDGGINVYAYVFNSPIELIDFDGLTAQVLTSKGTGSAGQYTPAGSGASSFGHTAMNVNGTTYSFGPGGWWVGKTDEYLAKNSFRDTIATTLNLTPEQEKALEDCLKDKANNDKGKYNKVSKTCVQEIKRCLEKVLGKSVTNQGPTPNEFRRNLHSERNLVKDTTVYPKK